MPYKIVDVVDAEEIPGWERKPPKWQELVDEVEKLKPNQALKVRFGGRGEANRARNAVRDRVNLNARAIVVRTRVSVDPKTGEYTLYLAKTHPVVPE